MIYLIQAFGWRARHGNMGSIKFLWFAYKKIYVCIRVLFDVHQGIV